MTRGDQWLPAGFVPPAPESVPFGHRLRPVAATDLARLLVADPGLAPERAERRLAGWLREVAAGTAHTYVLVDTDETAVLGGVRVDAGGASWWIVEQCRGTDLAAALDDLVPHWVAAHWPSDRP